jgi:ETC complex I subunit conserved region
MMIAKRLTTLTRPSTASFIVPSMTSHSRAIAIASVHSFSTKAPPAPVAPKPPAPEDTGLSPVTEHRQELTQLDRHLVYRNAEAEAKYLPAPVLPENISEISLLDQSDFRRRTKMDGSPRTVIIRQEKKSSRQAPLNPESSWRIFFYEDGTNSERWVNPLMGWTSNADPFQFNPPITFENAAEAVYFAKKCGWNYVVKQPILRQMRNDDAQYQDNFLKPAVAAKIQKEGVACAEWQRKEAATSHYFRPLNYHGTAPVVQHGPTGQTAPVAPHVPGLYKRR